MRPRTILLAILCLIVLATQANAATCCAPAQLATVTIAEDTKIFHIEVAYPVLCQPHATRIIRDHAAKSLARFKKDFPEQAPVPFSYKNEMITECSTTTAARGRLASVVLQTMVYTGGAHPNHWPDTFVFDMVDGSVFTLESVFRDIDASLEAVSAMVRPILKDKLQNMYVPSMFEDGVAPKADNFRHFIIEDAGITFIFPPYQVGPYAAGQQTATIPLNSLENLLSPEIRTILR